jgi:hypothetical protein
VAAWFWYAVIAAILYGAHQIFTKLAAGPHRRRLGRIRCRGHGCIIDLNLSRVSLVGEPLESAIQRAGNFLFHSHGRVRGRGHDCVFSSLPERRAVVSGPSHSCGRRSDHGHRGDSVLPGAGIVAAAHRNCSRDNRSSAFAPLIICRGRRLLAVAHLPLAAK